ncbi:TIR domain-containing protein [Heliobacillus mobilis]|uniref:TIR domain-containing protein n=1 Tax=Heliobacterium mobile TaxID=28064 RepID=A0A6I3SP50_HELMO|nr:TIR domain-containing protein [Heliobacterium mobile]MTV50833.1 TIR domain-containing protein [Heliobacterium mobile]
MTQEYIYDAFISYRHTDLDIEVAKKLHRLLENYRIPRSIAKQTGVKRIKRVFRDQEELPVSSDLSENIQLALKNSKYLIVVCSPNTPKSKWCCQEIETFKMLHGKERILPILIDGEPADSFPHSLRFHKVLVEKPDGSYSEMEKEIEPLAADVRGKNLNEMWKKLKVEKLRILAPMLGVTFDELKQRHREQFVKKVVGISLASSLIFAVFGGFSLFQSNVIAAQSLQLQKSNEEIEEKNQQLQNRNEEISRKNTQLENINQKLMAQIEETYRQQKLAETNEKEAIKQKNEAEKQTVIARKNELLARQNADLANEQTKIANQQKDNALKNQSLFLADLSRQETDKGNRTLAMRLALSALPKNTEKPERPYVEEAENALNYAIYDMNTSMSVLEHDSPFIDSLVFSPDGTKLKTKWNYGCKIWDVRNGKEIDLFRDNLKVMDAAFSPDGKKIATISDDLNLKLWDAQSGQVIATVNDKNREKKDGRGNILFSPDGSKVCTYGINMPLEIWDLATLDKVFSFQTEGPIQPFAFSPDGSKLIMPNQILDTVNWNPINKASRHLDSQGGFLSPDGNRYITISGGNGNVAKIYDLISGNELKTLEGNDAALLYATFSPDGKKAITTSRDATARIWDVDTGKELLVLKHDEKTYPTIPEYVGSTADVAEVRWADFSPDGKLVVTASNTGIAKVWNSLTGDIIATLKYNSFVNKAIFSPDGRKVVISSRDRNVRIWDLDKEGYTNHSNNMSILDYNVYTNICLLNESRNLDHTDIRMVDLLTGEELSVLKHKKNVEKARFNSDGSKVLTLEGETTVHVWGVKNKNPITIFNNDVEEIYGKVIDATFDHIGDKIAVLTNKNIVLIFNLENNEDIKSFTLDNSYHRLQFSPNDNLLVIINNPVYWNENRMSNITLWSVDNQKKIGEYPIPGNNIKIAFNKSGEKLFVSSYVNNGFQIFDLLNGKSIVQLHNETSNWDTYFNFDGSMALIVASNQEGAGAESAGEFITYLYDLNNGNEILKTKLQDDVNDVAFSLDGRFMAINSLDHNLEIWSVENGNEIARFDCNSVNNVFFSQDGKKIFLTDKFVESGVQVWSFFNETEKLVEYVRNKLGDYELTSEERRKFFLE